MLVWERFVMFLVAALFTLTQASGGSLGLAIIMLSFSVRLTLLPLTIRMARRAQERQARLLALEPMIRTLKATYRSDPQRLRAELIELYREHGCNPLDTWTIFGAFLQIPMVYGLYTAIKRGLGEGGRFLWIPNLARPDAILAMLFGGLTYLVSALNPGVPHEIRIVASLLPALVALWFAWNMASGVGLYWVTSSTVDVLQSALLRRSSK